MIAEANDDLPDPTPDENWRGRDPLITLADLCMFSGALSLPTVRRWVDGGVSGVKLKTEMRGGRRFTRVSWLAQFNLEIARVREERRKPK